MIRDLVISIRSILMLWILTVLIYPAVILTIGQLAFSNQANGSLITNAQGQTIGSALIGQTFTTDRYFWGRPSTVNYGAGKEAPVTGTSGGSNLAPSNPALTDRVNQEVSRLQTANIKPTADLVYTSGSGLDPHISPASAQAQIDRVAQARSIPIEQVQNLITQHTEGRFLGIFGEAGVNVLALNLALDQL